MHALTFVITLILQAHIPHQNTDAKCHDSKNDKQSKRTSWVNTQFYKHKENYQLHTVVTGMHTNTYCMYASTHTHHK